PVAPITVEQKLARKNELKAHGTLLMALPDKHQLKFNSHKDAKTLIEVIEKRFGGNTETKKVQKTPLKQEYENFTDSPNPTIVVEVVVQPVGQTSAEQKLAIWNELKARGTLLMALPDKHQLKFNSHKDAKRLMEAIKKRFRGNTETKKVQRTLLKQHFKNFTGSSSESLDQIYDRLQKLTHTLIWRNKADLEEQSLDDLFNSLKIYETEVKHSFSTSTTIQNLAFVSSSNTDSTTDSVSAAASVFAVCAKMPVSSLLNVDSLSNAMAMLTMRARRFLQKTCRNLGDNRPTSIGFDMSKVECYSCHRKGHFARECRSPKDSRRPDAADPQRRTVPTNEKHGLGYFSSESDYESCSPSSLSDRSQPDGGYHAVPPPITGTFMPPKPDLVFHTTPIAVETDHSAFAIQLSTSKPVQDLSHINRPTTPIIEDWASDSEDESKTKAPHIVPSFFQSFEQVKTCRHYVQPLETSIPVAPPKPTKLLLLRLQWLVLLREYRENRGNPKGGKISGKGKIKTGKLDFDDVYFVKELKFNLFSVSQICDKKNSVLFTDTECLVLSLDFKMPDESQVLLRVPRENNMYNVNLKNIVPSGDLTCLFAKATIDESNLWHRRLVHINFKTINKLVKDPLGQFEGKVDEGFLVGYSVNSKAFRLFYSRTRIVQETLHVNFLENKPNVADLSGEFEDCLENNMNEVIAAGSIVPIVGQNSFNITNPFSAASPSNITASPTYGQSSFKDASQPTDDPDMPELEDNTYSDDENAIGAEADFNNLETSITVSPIPTTRIHKDHPVSQIIGDLSSTTQTRRLEDPDHSDKVYKVVKALYGLHQAPRAWYETLANYLLENGFQRGKIDQTLFIKKQKGDILLVHIYVDDIIFGATNKELCKYFEKLMKDKFQMSSMGELTFFLGRQVKQKKDGIFISQDKYVAEILRKFGLTEGKSASTPIDTEKPFLKDPNGEDVDVHIYRSMIGSLMYLTSSRPDIMF
nr:putative ribonuclease H-like domain-containing protein [Tanacetum cinerariifolium]